MATVCQSLIFVSASPGDLVMLIFRGYIDRTFQEPFKTSIYSRLRVKPKPYRCCFYVSCGICGIGPPGVVVRGLFYHRAEVEISSQAFVTGPEKLSRPTYIPGWRCVKANRPGVSTPPASRFMISAK